MVTRWLNSESSDVHRDTKIGPRAVSELLHSPPCLGWASLRPKYMLACGQPTPVPHRRSSPFSCASIPRDGSCVQLLSVLPDTEVPS